MIIQISQHRDSERRQQKSDDDVPVRFSPAVYSPSPSVAELMTTCEQKNTVVILFVFEDSWSQSMEFFEWKDFDSRRLLVHMTEVS